MYLHMYLGSYVNLTSKVIRSFSSIAKPLTTAYRAWTISLDSNVTILVKVNYIVEDTPFNDVTVSSRPKTATLDAVLRVLLTNIRLGIT